MITPAFAQDSSFPQLSVDLLGKCGRKLNISYRRVHDYTKAKGYLGGCNARADLSIFWPHGSVLLISREATQPYAESKLGSLPQRRRKRVSVRNAA